jgi:hypothetical protein
MSLTSQYIALQNNADGTGPLASYFQGEELNTGKADTFTANMCVFFSDGLCPLLTNVKGEMRSAASPAV